MFLDHPKKLWRPLCLSALAIALLFTLSPSSSVTFSRTASGYFAEVGGAVQAPLQGHSSQAYVSIACSEDMIPGTLTLIHSLQQTQTNREIVILISSAITHNSLEQIRALGVKVEPFTSVAPQNMTDVSRSVAGRQAQEDDSCRWSKISLWKLQGYDKIIYLGPNNMVLHNVDFLFAYPSLSAAKTPSQIIDTDIMVLTPSMTEFESMMTTLGSSEDDSALINLAYKFRPEKVVDLVAFAGMSAKAPIPTNELYRQSVDIVQFNPAYAPWNFIARPMREWELFYDPRWFYQWRKLELDMNEKLKVHKVSIPEYTEPIDASTWNNAHRLAAVCDNYVPTMKPFTNTEQFSVMISTYHPNRLENLKDMIRKFADSDKIARIYVTWHDPNLPVNKELSDMASELRVPLEFLTQDYDSLNNRFNPVSNLETEAVYICDDDMSVGIKDLEFTFRAWQAQKDSIAGHNVRVHTYDENAGEYNYFYNAKYPEYSMVLTKTMFVKSEYLFAYTCLMPPPIHEYVDRHLNCEDIAFNIMVSGMSAAPPVAVRSTTMVDYGRLDGGISSDPSHISNRGACLTDLMPYFGGKDTLILSDNIVGRLNEMLKTPTIPKSDNH